MERNLVQELTARNKKIIEAVIEKVKKVCPDSIALIGIAGSFCSGDFYEKSDLDLCIVINDDDGWKIGSCFILDDVAHDIYCTYWHQLEEMAQYNNPYVTKLLHLDIVYCADDKYLKKYMDLREKVTKILNEPFGIDDLKKVKNHYDSALKAYGKMMIEDEYTNCKYASADVIYYIEFIIYMVNKAYIKRGVKRIPEEIYELKKLPLYFNEYYYQSIKADTLESIKENVTMLIKCVTKYLNDVEKETVKKKNVNGDRLKGMYEEIFSNWRNKMYYAAENNEPYLSFMSAASCQMVYDDLYEDCNVKRINLMKDFKINDLRKSAEAYDSAMEECKKLYEENGVKVVKYKNITEFTEDYLK